jgi:TIR domain
MAKPSAVAFSNLGRLTLLAKGSHGTIFRAEDFRLHGTSTPIVYKEFNEEGGRQAGRARRAVEFRDALPSAELALLDERCIWPLALVEKGDQGQPAGFLMPLIQTDFFCCLADPDTGQIVTAPRMMTWLISTAKQRKAARIDLAEVDKTERLMLLAQLSGTIGLLHRHGRVFGDLHFGNVVFALNPPRIRLLRCYNAAAPSGLASSQDSAPFWVPPEFKGNSQKTTQAQELQDGPTEVYKLGLAILRSLTPGQGASTATAPSRINDELDSDGAALVSAALSPDRLSRPTADELTSYLSRKVSQRIGVPEALLAGRASPQPAVSAPGGHAFISYVSDDSEVVDRLQHDLERAGVVVWRDRTSLGVGDRWKESIRRAISDGAFFICCFSEASGTRARSYMNEELTFAIEELRVRNPQKIWFLPVVLPGGDVPDRPVNAHESLRDFHYTFLSPDNWDSGISNLVRSIQRP